jgi:hypothetical protein
MVILKEPFVGWWSNYKVKVKGKGKVAPVLNQAPCHEDVLGEWRYSSTHSSPWH